MSTPFITPIQTVGSLSELTKASKTSGADGSEMFKNIFGDMVDSVKESEADLAQKQYLLSTGQIDDAHTVPIAAAQAQLSVDMLVQLRNKALDAYNELMRISL